MARKVTTPRTLAQLKREMRRLMRVAGGGRRFTPMWARYQTYARNPALVGLDGNALIDADVAGVAACVATQQFSEVVGGVWDGLLHEWTDAAAPESPEDVVTFPISPHQVEAVWFREMPVKRIMLLGGPGSGKTLALAHRSLLHGGGLIDRRSYLTWGMVGATTERVLDPFYRDMFGLDGEPGFVPEAWILDKNSDPKGTGGIYALLVNHCRFSFMTAQEQSKRAGSKVQGKTWDGGSIDETQSVHDRVQADVDERGRAAGVRFQVGETATRIGTGHFELRLETYKESKYKRIIRLNPFDNVFVHPAHYERLRGDYSAAEYRRRILAEDVAREHLVYSAFNYAESVRPAPRGERGRRHPLDVTRQLTGERFNGSAYDWVVGTDFGSLCTVSMWLKAFRDPKSGDTLWWIMHETTSGSHTKADAHAKKLVQVANPADFIVVADPGINTKDVDKSDYELTKRQGVNIRPAHFEPVIVRHRVNMLDALLGDANGVRRLFVDCSMNNGAKVIAAPKFVQSCLTQTYSEDGHPEKVRKDYSDPTHWPAAVSYGVWPWEQLRGRSTFDIITGGAVEDPLLQKARDKEMRRVGGGGYP